MFGFNAFDGADTFKFDTPMQMEFSLRPLIANYIMRTVLTDKGHKFWPSYWAPEHGASKFYLQTIIS